MTTPPSNVTAGSGFGLSVTAEYGSGIVDTLFTGSATVSLANVPPGGSTTLGGTTFTVSANKGVASFSGLTLNKAVAGYTLHVASSGAGTPAAVTTNGFSVSAAGATHLAVTAEPPSPVNPGQGFNITVEALDPFNNAATGYGGSAMVTLAHNAGGVGTSISGTTTGNFSPSGSTPGFLTFSGLSLNNDGTGYTLGISSSIGGATTTPFDVTGTLPPPPPPPPIVSSESAVLTQKKNKKGKPVGKPSVSGYTITFSTAMDQSALATGANYEVDVLKTIKTVTTKVGKRKIKTKVPVYGRIGFTIPASGLTSDSVTLMLAGKQTFPKGGRIQVFSGGVDNTSGVALAQTVILTISPKGTRIS